MPFIQFGQLPDPLGFLKTSSNQKGWTNYTPTLTASTTNPTLGTGSVAQGRYTINEQGLVLYQFYIQFGSSGVNGGSGEYRISAPVKIAAPTITSEFFSQGTVVMADWSSAGHKELAVLSRNSEDDFQMFVDNATVWHDNPFTWAADDRFGGTAFYELKRG